MVENGFLKDCLMKWEWFWLHLLVYIDHPTVMAWLCTKASEEEVTFGGTEGNYRQHSVWVQELRNCEELHAVWSGQVCAKSLDRRSRFWKHEKLLHGDHKEADLGDRKGSWCFWRVDVILTNFGMKINLLSRLNLHLLQTLKYDWEPRNLEILI